MNIRSFAAVLTLGAVGFAGCGVDTGPAGSDRPFTNTTAPAAPTAAAAPAVADFTLELVTTSNDCYGSAGGLMTVDVDVDYHGLGYDGTHQLIYRVDGAEDGPITGNLTVRPDGTYTSSSHVVGTANCSDTLSVALEQIR